MRKIKFFSMLAAAALIVGAASCNSDNGGVIDNGGEHATITLKFANDVVQTRATDDLNGLEQTIVNVQDANVFMFTAGGALVFKDYVSTAADLVAGKTYAYVTGDPATHGLTTAITKVMVVGNVGDLTALSGITNEATVSNAVIKALGAAEVDYNAATPKVWVYGETSPVWGTPASGVTPGTATLEMNPVMTRIDITANYSGVTGGLDDSYPAIVFEGAAILYSASYTHVSPTFAPTLAQVTTASGAAVYASGLDDMAYPLWTSLTDYSVYDPNTGGDNFLNATWTGTWNSADNLVVATKIFSRSFYAYAPGSSAEYNKNSSAVRANTIATVYGRHITYDENDLPDVTTPLFWPVHFSPTESAANAEYLRNGYVYKVNISFTGDFSNGGGGVPDPETPVNPASITVTIDKVQWKAVIIINKEFTGS